MAFLENLDRNLELRPLQKSIELLIKMFTYLLLFDIVFCVLFKEYMHLISSVILISGVVTSRLFFNYEKAEFGIIFLAFVFYIIGFFHVVYMDDYITCYFILITVPIITSLLLESIRLKIILILCSSVFFVACNFLSGLNYFENYFFFYGVFPSSILMIHFNNRLMKLTQEKNTLIDQLKEKNDEVLLFSNMMSHDLKAPLRNIDGFSKLLQKRLTDLDKKESEMFSYIVQGVDSLKKLIDDLLEFSKLSLNEYAFKEIELEPLINKLLVSFNYDIAKDNIVIVKSNLSKIYGHEESLTLVFQNLISNAIKYQPKVESHIPRIEISQNNTHNHSLVFIKDNGIGIEKSKFEEVFMPFKRFHAASEYEGTGLGMSIVNKVIEKHKGTIEIRSELKKSSTFIVSLPSK